MATHPSDLRADDVPGLPVPGDAIGLELVDGRPVPVTPASPLHGRIAAVLGRLLDGHVTARGLPGRVYHDTGFVLGLARDPERMRGPDLAYVGGDKIADHPDPERFFRCAPDLAVEIDLASGTKPGGQQRIVDYLEAGVRLVWSIDPRSRTATVYRADGSARLVPPDGTLAGEDVVPGFRVGLADLFD